MDFSLLYSFTYNSVNNGAFELKISPFFHYIFCQLKIEKKKYIYIFSWSRDQKYAENQKSEKMKK